MKMGAGGELTLGREHWLAPVRQQSISLPKAHKIWTQTGRAALYIILEDILKRGGKRIAFVPAYCCESVLAPFRLLGFRINFYSMGEDFNSPQVSGIVDGASFLYIHYFGFRNDAIIERLKATNSAKKLFVIEDCVQASLNQNVGSDSDYAFNSCRKFLPQPDGALLASKTRLNQKLAVSDEAFVSGKILGKILRGYQIKGDSFLEIFKEAEDRIDQDCLPRSMSLVSSFLMQRTNIRSVSRRRRENWKVLNLGFKTRGFGGKGLYSIFPRLQDGDVPLGFPVRITGKRRDALRGFLKLRGVFCPIHWPIDHLRASSWKAEVFLSQSILTLPLDQTLGKADMNYILQSIGQFVCQDIKC